LRESLTAPVAPQPPLTSIRYLTRSTATVGRSLKLDNILWLEGFELTALVMCVEPSSHLRDLHVTSARILRHLDVTSRWYIKPLVA
jgi:hypothetical protein